MRVTHVGDREIVGGVRLHRVFLSLLLFARFTLAMLLGADAGLAAGLWFRGRPSTALMLMVLSPYLVLTLFNIELGVREARWAVSALSGDATLRGSEPDDHENEGD